MSVKLTISIPDVDQQLAAGFDFIRVFRSTTGSAGPYGEVTNESPQPAGLTGTLAGPFTVSGLTFSARLNRGPVQASQITGTDPLSASQTAAALMADIQGLVGQDDGTGRLQLRTDGTGTDEVLELLGDSLTLERLGFTVGQLDTGEAARVPIVQGVTSYLFEDVSGTAENFYKVDFINSATQATSAQSDPVKGTIVETCPKGQAESRAPRGLTLVRKTSHIFRNAFFADADESVPLVPLDASRYPSFQIVDINGQIVSSGLATLDGQPGHYRVEFFVAADAAISNDDRRWRLEWLFVDENNRQFEKTTEFDVRDVEVTATPTRDIKLLAMCDQPLRLFIRELRRPYSVVLNVTDTGGTVPIAEGVVWPGSGAADEEVLTEVVEGETYVYYYDVGPGLLSVGPSYQAVWQIRDSVASVAQHAFQVIEVPPTAILQYMPSLRMVIDKYQKRRQLLQAYQDSDLYEYLIRGLEIVNGWHPLTSFQMTSLPNQLVPYWLMAGQLWGLNAQFLLETDLSFDFCLDRDSLVRTDRGLVKLRDLGGVDTRVLAAEKLIQPAQLALLAAITMKTRGRYRAQALVDGMGLDTTARNLGMLMSHAGLSYARQSDGAGGWLWDTTRFDDRLRALTTGQEPPSFETSYALRSGGHDRAVRQVYDLGVKPCHTVRSTLGYEVVGTRDHAFLTLNTETLEPEWKRLGELAVGDVIAIDAKPDADDEWDVTFDDVSDVAATNRGKDIYRLPTRLTPALARVLGYLVSEGSCSSYNKVTFGVTDDKLLQDFCRDFESVFGAPPTDEGFGQQSPDQYAYDPTRTETDMRYVTGRGVVLRRFLASIGLGYGRSRDKEVPWCILQAPLSLVAEFLKAYFDGDGCFTPSQIFFCSFSERLRYQIQTLLLRFGVVSRNADTSVTVRQPSLGIYADTVGFLRKSGQVEELTLSSTRESLPAALTDRLRSITALFGIKRGWARNGRRYTMGWVRRDRTRIARRHLNEWWEQNRDDAYEVDSAVAERVRWLVEAPISWQEVVAIENAGERHVMDPALHGGPGLLDHSFTAGGVITHNSGQTVTLNYDHTGNLDTAISRATDFIREGLGPVKTAIYRRQSGPGVVAGRPYRYTGIHNFVFPISRMSSQDFLTMISHIGLL